MSSSRAKILTGLAALTAAGGIAGGLLATRGAAVSAPGFGAGPDGVKACQNYKMSFRWDPVPGAVEYGVFLDGSYVTTTRQPVAVRIPVPCGQHQLGVQAADKDGNLSPTSVLTVDGARQ